MRLTVHGTRGSYPVCRAGYNRFGGNTTCLFLRSGQDQIIIDGGSGLLPLGDRLARDCDARHRVHVFLTHPHWDHVVGFPFFRPAYDARFTITIYGADSENKKLEQIFQSQYRSGSFPVAFDALPARMGFHRLQAGDEVRLVDTTVRCIQLNHPGMDLGYRFDSARGSIVILTDLAPIVGNILGLGMKERAADHPHAFEQDYQSMLVDFIKGADLVLYDTNFTEEEIVGKQHWGHSTPQEALQVLGHLDAPPGLVLAHHDPDHDDACMDEIYRLAGRAGGSQGIDVFIAKEGGSFEL
ncbi:MAG: hypothetical protein DRI90_20735 [Deltaproteobacteria bacterium]|nr:MAG: hypothetical protein DRI90_20735 [Deltaproteobacteria bacterium]